MKRYIRDVNNFYGHGIIADENISDDVLENEYGDDNITYEFDSLDEMWEWLNDEDT